MLIVEELETSSGPGTELHTTRAWYILNGAVLQCPDLHTVVAVRLVRICSPNPIATQSITMILSRETPFVPFEKLLQRWTGTRDTP